MREQLLIAYGFKRNESGAFVFKERVGNLGGPIFLIVVAYKNSQVTKAMILDVKNKRPRLPKHLGAYDIKFEKTVNQRLRQLEPVIGKWMCVRRLNVSCNHFILN